MAVLSHISSDLTVRQIALAFPACADLLQRWPAARHDNRWTLQQLGPFARQAGVDEQRLLRELSDRAGVQAQRGRPLRRTHSPLPLIFTALVVGTSMGAAFGVGLLLRIGMSTAYDAAPASSVHVHGLAQLWGWMTLFIFAVAAHLLRQNTTRPAPRALEWLTGLLILAGLAVFFAGLNHRIRANLPQIDIVGSCLLAGATASFGVCVIWSLSGAARTQRRHALVFMVGWLWAWAAADLWLRVRHLGAPILPDGARSLLIVLPVLGLATNAIYAFGIRLIPGLLNVARLRPRWFTAALLMHNAGLCLYLTPLRIPAISGAALMLLGAVCYLIGMDWLRSKPSRPIYGIDPRGHVLIRIAFFWLICGLAMVLGQQLSPALPHPYSGAWRHALTVGFVTTMILGVGYRIVPIFIRQPLASNRLMLISAALVIVGNAARVALELLTIGGWTWSYRMMGMTGVLELTALILFAVNLAATAHNRRRVYRGGASVTADTRVQELVNVRPEVQERLRVLGLTMFDDAPFIAPSMTLGALALASRMKPEQLIQSLGGAISQK